MRKPHTGVVGAALAGLAALLLAPAGTAEEAPAAAEPRLPKAMRVGEIGGLDLDMLREVIEAAQNGSREAEEFAPLGGGGRSYTLEEAVRESLVKNLRILIAEESRDLASHKIPEADARFHPTVGFNLQAADSRQEDMKGGPHERAERRDSFAFVSKELSTGGSIQFTNDMFSEDTRATSERYDSGIGVELRQPLLRGGRTYVARREVLDAEFDYQIEEARLQTEILSVTAETKSAYYDTLVAARIIDVTNEAIDRDLDLLEASEALFQAGRATKRDALSASISLSKNLARLAERRQDAELAANRLRDVMGVPIGTRVDLAERSIEFKPVPLRLNEWVRSALENRPELLEVRTELDKNELGRRVAGNGVLPQVDLVGLYRRNQEATSLRDSYHLDSNAWRAGVEFSIPLWNVAARERLTQAEIEERRTRRELRQLERQIELEVRDVVVQLGARLARLRALTTTVQQSREKLEVARARYRLGLANNFDITDAQEDLRDAETDLLRALADYEIGLAVLESRIARPL